MNKLFDLRFVIGIFFIVIGAILIVYGFLSKQLTTVNEWCGVMFLVFGLFMLLLSIRKPSNGE